MFVVAALATIATGKTYLIYIDESRTGGCG